MSRALITGCSTGIGRATAGEIDILVNNAGIGVGGPVESVPMRDFLGLDW